MDNGKISKKSSEHIYNDCVLCLFQEGSRELEAELEAQLEQAEGKIKEYRSLSNRLHMDNDELKAKLEQCHKEYAFQVGQSIPTKT